MGDRVARATHHQARVDVEQLVLGEVGRVPDLCAAVPLLNRVHLGAVHGQLQVAGEATKKAKSCQPGLHNPGTRSGAASLPQAQRMRETSRGTACPNCLLTVLFAAATQSCRPS